MRPGAVSLAPFQLERLSLPDSIRECPRIETLLPAEALSYLKGHQERMLDPHEKEPEVKEFLDPTLRYNQKKYQQLVGEPHRRALVRALDYEEERVGLFAVWKVKSQSQRLIVDTRRSNARFLPPPEVDLLSAEALARV